MQRVSRVDPGFPHADPYPTRQSGKTQGTPVTVMVIALSTGCK